MICKIGKSLAEIENFLKEKYIQEMVLAPNVGIVKFKSEEKQISDEVKTLELKSYEIKPNNSENEENK